VENIFLAALTIQQRFKLESFGISFYDLNLAGEAGVVLEGSDLPQVLNILEASVVGKEASSYQGIKRVVLKLNPSVTAPDGRHTITADKQSDLNDVIISALTQILVPVIDRDVVLHHQRLVGPPIEDGKFHLYIWWRLPTSSDRVDTRIRTPETIWGIPIQDEHRYSRAAGGVGIPIQDDVSGCVVAELRDKNTLYIHRDVFILSANNSEEKLFRQVLLHTASLLLPPEKGRELARQLFIEECAKSTVRVLAATAAQYANHKERVKQLRKELSECIRTGLSDERKLLRGNGTAAESFGEEYEGLLKVPKVKDVRVEANAIAIFTEVLNCRDDRTGRLHEIGAFKIQIPFQGSSPIWTNLTRKVDGYKERQNHPHIWSEGDACLGSSETLFQDLFASREFAIAAQLAIEFVESANTKDPAGKYISKWPLARC
jgi:hypothetical protein